MHLKLTFCSFASCFLLKLEQNMFRLRNLKYYYCKKESKLEHLDHSYDACPQINNRCSWQKHDNCQTKYILTVSSPQSHFGTFFKSTFSFKWLHSLLKVDPL